MDYQAVSYSCVTFLGLSKTRTLFHTGILIAQLDLGSREISKICSLITL